MYVLVAVVVLLLGIAYYARARRQHLAATVAATRTRGDYLPEAIWHLQAHDGLSPTKARALRACRTTFELTTELTADRHTAPREASVLLGQVRARRVSRAAVLAHRGLDAGAPALDGVLGELGTHVATGAYDRAAGFGVQGVHEALRSLGVHLAVADQLPSLADHLTHAVEQVAGEILDSHIPLLTTLTVGYREAMLVRQGKDVGTALEHAGIDIVGRGSGAMAGAKAVGLAAGAAFPGAGHVVGAVVGAVAGGMVGTEVANRVKRRPLTIEHRELEASVAATLPAPPSAVESYLRAVIDRPLADVAGALRDWRDGTDRPSLRQRFWPTAGELAYRQSVEVGERAQQSAALTARQEQAALDSALGQHRETALGAILLNCPGEAAQLGVQADKLAAVLDRQARVALVRRQLFTG